MIAAALLIAAYLCLPPLRQARIRLPELIANGDAPHDQSSRIRAITRAKRSIDRACRFLVGGRISPVMLLDTAAALDVIASCLRSGMSPSAAMSAAADGAREELAEPLHLCAAQLAVGSHSAWEGLAEIEILQPLSAAGRRASESGTELVRALADAAADYRNEAHDAAQAIAEKAGVLIAGPLALCFLPAFVVLGLIPTIAGLADDMFTGLVPS